jgi:hypothetical protein
MAFLRAEPMWESSSRHTLPVARNFPAPGLVRSADAIVNTDDRRLIADCLAGHTPAFGDLVRRYQDRLFNAVLRVVDQPEDAADVVQDAFLNAYQSLNSFKGDSEFFTWLYRIAFNAAISLRRKRKAILSFDGVPDTKTAEPIDPSEFTRAEVRGHRRDPGRADRYGPEPAAPGAAGTPRPAPPRGMTRARRR